MISESVAFDQILAHLRPALAARAFELLDVRETPEPLESRSAIFSDGRRLVRLTWDGRERFFVLEGDAEPHLNGTGQPAWLDLTLQLFDPRRADETWVDEVARDVVEAFEEFAG